MPEQNTAGYELVLGSGGSPQGPAEVLPRKIRSDQGQPPAFGPKLVEVLTAQYREHPHWNDQLHADHLVVLLENQPELGSIPAYVSVRRVSGLYSIQSELGIALMMTHKHHSYYVGKDFVQDMVRKAFKIGAPKAPFRLRKPKRIVRGLGDGGAQLVLELVGQAR